MAKTTLTDIKKVLSSDDKATDFHYYGTVASINEEDKTYEIDINHSGTTITAAKLAGAKVGDTVMVTVMANGYATVTGCLGGDQDAADAAALAQEAKDTMVEKAQSDWIEFDTAKPAYIKNKPAIKQGSVEGSIVESDLDRNIAASYASHAEGVKTQANGWASHTEGWGTIADGQSSHAEGGYTHAEGEYSHAEGYKTKATAYGWASHVEGRETTANGDFSHAEGQGTVTGGDASHAEGYKTNAYHHYSHAEGESTKALAKGAHAEGYGTTAEGEYSHAEGYLTKATGMGSHAGGLRGEAKGSYSFAHGDASYAEGACSVAFSMGVAKGGLSTALRGGRAEGGGSFAWGSWAEAIGEDSMALGDHCKTQYAHQIAIGQYNRLGSTNSDDSKNCVFVVGTGPRKHGEPERYDALALTKYGDLHIAGHVYEQSMKYGALTGYRLLNTEAFDYEGTVFYTQESSDQQHPGLKVYIDYDVLRKRIILIGGGTGLFFDDSDHLNVDYNWIAEKLEYNKVKDEVTSLYYTMQSIQRQIDGLIGG